MSSTAPLASTACRIAAALDEHFDPSTAAIRQVLAAGRMTFTPCGCPEARLLRLWLHDPWSLPDRELFAVLYLLADLLIWRRMKQASRDLSSAANWASIAARHSTHAELARRRYPPHGDPDRWVRDDPPDHRPIDRAAMARWAAIGHTHHHDPREHGRTPKADGRELDGQTWDQYPDHGRVGVA